MLGLQELKLQQTVLRGRLPPELGQLPYLIDVDVRNTLMTCCNDERTADSAARDGRLLPPYLEFDMSRVFESPIQLPNIGFNGVTGAQIPDAAQKAAAADGGNDADDPGANMQCPRIIRSPSAQPTPLVLAPADLSAQTWRIDPEYYWFEPCRCLQGYEEMRNNRQRWLWRNSFLVQHAGYPPIDMRILNCVPRESLNLLEIAAATVGAGTAGAVLLMLGYCFCCRRASKPVRAFHAMRKRAMGMPKAGRVSIVVTDIEGYSGALCFLFVVVCRMGFGEGGGRVAFE
jgi:hypothetical protein